MTTATAIIQAEPKQRLQVGVSECLIRLNSEQTGGGLSIVEFRMPGGAMGAMPHIHEGHSEDFIIVSGEITFDLVVDGVTAVEKVGAGGTVSVPPGVAHGFRNSSDSEALLIGLFRPGGYERYFREVHEMVVAGHVPTPEDLAQLRSKYRTVTL